MTAPGVSFHRETIEVLISDTQVDRYGNEKTPVWESYTTTAVDGCRLLPVEGGEVVDRRTRRYILFAPAATVLDASNRVRWSGTTFEVLDVRTWPSPTGRLAHIEADLQRVEG